MSIFQKLSNLFCGKAETPAEEVLPECADPTPPVDFKITVYQLGFMSERHVRHVYTKSVPHYHADDLDYVNERVRRDMQAPHFWREYLEGKLKTNAMGSYTVHWEVERINA